MASRPPPTTTSSMPSPSAECHLGAGQAFRPGRFGGLQRRRFDLRHRSRAARGVAVLRGGDGRADRCLHGVHGHPLARVVVSRRREPGGAASPEAGKWRILATLTGRGWGLRDPAMRPGEETDMSALRFTLALAATVI